MKYFEWNKEKNEFLRKERNISFEIIVSQIESGKLPGIIEHPDKERYKNQRIFIIEYNEYVYNVPFIEDEEKIFLKNNYTKQKDDQKIFGGIK